MRLNKPHPMTSELLKNFRRKTKLNQEQFIKTYKIDIAQSVFSRWETGKIAVPVSVLLNLGILQVCDAEN